MLAINSTRGQPLTAADRWAVDLIYWPARLCLHIGRLALAWSALGTRIP
jgi:hypothetical protein